MAYNKKLEDRRNHLRDTSIVILEEIKSKLTFYELDIYYAKKWEKIQQDISRRNKKHSLRRFLFLKFTYDLYEGEPPTIEWCEQKYSNYLRRYASVLKQEYWSVDIVDELLNFLQRKKAYTISEAIALYKQKFV